MTAVVDAFKNLLHGKHPRRTHKQADNNQAPPISADQRKKQCDPHQPAADTAGAQLPPKDIPEIIINEECDAKSKMPSYPGLDKFNLLQKMGDGAFSNVYKAIDAIAGTQCAVKVVRKYEMRQTQQANQKHLNSKFKKPRAVERTSILKEVQIMRSINHRSIVKLNSFSESPEHYFLVLELMDGGELFHQIVKLTYFSENLSRHVILQVAQGIRYLHEERGIVHRDIKPENILFERIPIIPSKVPIVRKYDENKEDEGEFIPGRGGGGIGRVKIADFGLSKVIWNEETKTPCGTVGYTAPEIVKDELYSKSVDMWALGCVLYTLLCGFPPFFDESISALTTKVANGVYTFLKPWWDEIGDSSKDLIRNLLCVDTAVRFTIDEFLGHPWITAMPGPPPSPIPFSVMPMDSPLLTAARGGQVEGRSPRLATLKDAFDVAYAMHRAEEEGARRRKYHGRGGAGVKGFLHGVDEDHESEDDGHGDEEDKSRQAQRRTQVSQAQTPRKAVANPGHRTKAFELDLHKATLLGRRRMGSPFATTNPLSNAIEGMRVREL